MIQRRGAQKYPDTVWGKGNPPKVGRKNLSAWACAEEAQDCFFRTPSGEKALFMLGERQGQPLEAAAAGGAGSRSLLLRDLFHCPNTVPAGAGTDLEESNMVFGLLKDIKNGEYRTIATPAEIATIVACRGARERRLASRIRSMRRPGRAWWTPWRTSTARPTLSPR